MEDEDNLSSLASDAASKLDVLGHDCDSLGMDGCQVGVLKQTNQVSLSCLLKGQNSAGLEPQVCLEVLGNLTHKPLERKLADQQLSRLLVLPDLTKSHSSWSVPVFEEARVSSVITMTRTTIQGFITSDRQSSFAICEKY